MNPRDAKATVTNVLAGWGLHHRLTARTIGFEDLARASMVFVTIHGWRPDARWDELRALAVSHGFRVEASS